MRIPFVAAAFAATVMVASAQPAAAATRAAFSQPAFDAARKAGKPILIDVYASWCPICVKQQPAIAAIASDPRHRDLTIFRVDFDKQKAAQKQFRVTRQSTLIAYRGAKETGRSIGETNAAKIAALAATTG